MWEILASIVWACFATYTIWYFTSAKNFAPITYNEARILWKIHKKTANCNGRKWREIKHKDAIVGFECECGYKHIQRRPIIRELPKVENHMANPSFAIQKLHNAYEPT
ncbi:MAG: hypothetical protein ACP5IM_06560 [Candidatus Bathyarchaeia archaeon]